VKLRPKVLKECQDAVVKTYGEAARFYLVFHGGSGSTQEEIHEALDYGVVRTNVDTDMQYAFTRAIAGQMFKNYDGVLKVDGEVGNKKAYDPRSYLALVFQFCAGPVAVAFLNPCLRCVREEFSGPRQSLGHCVPRRDQTAQSSPIRPRRDANSNRARHHRCYSACHRVRDRR
jgi:hypothetical protein